MLDHHPPAASTPAPERPASIPGVLAISRVPNKNGDEGRQHEDLVPDCEAIVSAELAKNQ